MFSQNQPQLPNQNVTKTKNKGLTRDSQEFLHKIASGFNCYENSLKEYNNFYIANRAFKFHSF